MLRKYDGYFARMMSQFDRDHYRYGTPFGEQEEPLYFKADVAIDGPEHNERTPEFYFAGGGFMNVTGGAYNPLYEGLTAGEGESYNIAANPFPPLISSCDSKLDREQHDYFSRPYTVLPEVPTGPGSFNGVPYYEPSLMSRAGFDEANRHLPFMHGSADQPWKSANVAT